MADMLTIATLSANTFKKALEVTSHNVANVSTEGYTRQRAVIVSNAPGIAGNSFQGSGSSVQSVERTYSEYYQSQLVVAESLKSRYDQQLNLSKQIEGVVASNDEGIQEYMSRFFNSLQSLSNNPTSSTSRQLVLDEASSLETHIDNLTTVVDESKFQLNNQIYDNVEEINIRLESVQALNERIEYATKTTGQQPNDLMDQRDQAILELGQYIDVKQYNSANGTMDIYTGNGRIPLISGNTLTRITAEPSEYRADNRVELYIKIGDEKRQVSDLVQGGELGGILDYRTNMLDQVQTDLGLTLNGVIGTLNWQHYQGYDLNGEAGGDIFAPLSTAGVESSNNEGTVSGTLMQVSFNPNPTDAVQPPYNPTQLATYADKQSSLENAYSEVARFQARDYELVYDDATSSYGVFDYKTKQAVEDNAGNAITISAADGVSGWQKNVEGLYFDLNTAANAGTPQDGDSFLLKPHQDILTNFNKVLNDTNAIAARGQTPDPTVTAPLAGADGDNTNMANMAALQSKNVLLATDSGEATETLLGGYSKMASNVGMYVRSTDIQLTAQTNVYDQVWSQRESFSGVSLDEEAANLIKYQQAYQATAQIISTVQQMFQTLLSVTGR